MAIGKKDRANISLLSILIIPIAIAVNFVGGSLALALKLPLYLDSIGTFLVAMLAGPLVGAIAGFLSLLFVSTTDPTSLPWAVLATMVGFLVGWLARLGMFTRLWRAGLSTILIIITSVTMVVTIRLVVFGGFTTSGSSVIAAALTTAGVPMIPAQVVSSLAAETPDKILSVALALLVIRSMSDRYLIKFPNGHLFTRHARKAIRRGDKNTPAVQAPAHTGLEPLEFASAYGTYDRWRGTRPAGANDRSPR
jgi:energy-coupling factor transport system substrate-specific component